MIEAKAKLCNFMNFETEIEGLTSAVLTFEIEIAKL
jgi:hypothetical protein